MLPKPPVLFCQLYVAAGYGILVDIFGTTVPWSEIHGP